MAPVDDAQLRSLIQDIVGQVLSRRTEPQPKANKEKPTVVYKGPTGKRGVFTTVDEAVDAAQDSQRHLLSLSLETRKAILDAIRKVGVQYAEDFSRRTVEETHMGRVEDKAAKFKLVAEKTPGIEDITPTAWSGDHGLSIVEMAPYGVIGAITPSTHPIPTMMNNALCIIAAGNSVVFNPHPQSKKVFTYAVDLFNEAIISAGGPSTLIVTVEEPTIQTAQMLFTHPGIQLLLVTGGPGVVKAAMSSSKKAIAAGPGNPPVVVDETADIPRAARDIVAGCAFDNNIVCIGEKEVFVVESVADELKRHLLDNGSYELTQYQLDQLEKKYFVHPEGASPDAPPVLNRNLVGRDASVIAAAIGLEIDPYTRILIAETVFDNIFVQEEQLGPILPIVRCKDVDEAIELAIKAEHGYGHTAIMHSRNVANMSKMARLINTTIFVKNGPSFAGLGVGGEGYTSFSIASPTGEGLTAPRHFTRMRRCVLVDYFRII